MATMVNVGLLAATLMSWGDRFLGAHQPRLIAAGSGTWVCGGCGRPRVIGFLDRTLR